MYSLFVIFVSVPLYFSHVFSPIGLIIWDVSSFERQKVYLFLILVFIAIIEWLIRFSDSILHTLKEYFFVIMVTIIIPLISSFFTGVDFFSKSNLLGSYEKHHGYIFYIGIIIFIVLVISSPMTWIKKYITGSIMAAVAIACIAIWERIGWIVDIYGRSEMVSMYSWRSSSTLGNPNYVAGYLLMFIPIVASQISQYKKHRWIYILVLALLLLAIYMTGSYIGLYLIFSLFLYYNVVYIFSNSSIFKQLIIFFLILSLITYIAYIFMDTDKLLSLQSRFILMEASMSALWNSPLSFLVWFWSEGILSYFSHTRSLSVNSYFPQSMLIDSSHNIIIDIIFQYGILPISILIWILYKYRYKILTSIGLSILLSILFLSLNVIVISHLLVLILMLVALCFQDNKKPR